ncbi:hypothetical protein Tco_1165788 [Tanacetum coccineum]
MNDDMPTTYSYYKAYSSVKRPFNKKTANYNRYVNKRVNTVKSTRVNTARPKAEVNTVKASASWVWKPKHEELDHVFKSNSASKTLTRYDYVDALGRFKSYYGDKRLLVMLMVLLFNGSVVGFVIVMLLQQINNNDEDAADYGEGLVSAARRPDLWIVVLRIGKLQGIGEFSGVGFISTQQMVINSPCLTDTKNWLFQCKRHLLASPKQTALELAIPGQTATGKESSNPFMAGSLPKTIHFCDSLQSDEDSFELIELMILCTNFLNMMKDDSSMLVQKDAFLGLRCCYCHDYRSKHLEFVNFLIDADAEVTFIDETSNDARNKNNKISNNN